MRPDHLFPGIAVFLTMCGGLTGQSDSIQHAIYNRPFVYQFGKAASVGGYFEANGGYFVEDGISEGFSFEARRFNVFLYSSISPGISLFSELEFEHGTEEIALETAVIDFVLDPVLIFRMGVLLPPLGKFNIEHDSPKYTIIDRPLVSTRVIPSTLSEIGVGFYGRKYLNGENSLGYEIYAVNGLSDGITDNEEGATSIPDGKRGKLLEEDNNGIPSLSCKIEYASKVAGQFGLSFYGGFYNRHRQENLVVDKKRSLKIAAFDHELSGERFLIRSEFAFAQIDVPENLEELFARKQWGFYSEINFSYYRGSLFNFPDIGLVMTVRIDRVDLNEGTFESTNTTIGEETTRLSIANGVRFTEDTVISMVYQYNWATDFLRNHVNSAGIQIGVASYF